MDVRPLREMTGDADFNEVFFDEVRIPAANMIGGPGEGWRVAGASLAEERSGVGGGGGGGVDPVLRLVDLARRHTRGGRPAIDDGAVRQQIGAFAARGAYSASPRSTCGHQGGRGRDTPADAPLSKIWFSELNLEMAEAALALQGARSMASEGDELCFEDGRWQDAFLYARAWTIAGGSNEIMRNLIAEHGLGLPREPRRTVVTSTSRHTPRTTRPHSQRARGAAAANDPFPVSRRCAPDFGAFLSTPEQLVALVLVCLFETDRGPYLIDTAGTPTTLSAHWSAALRRRVRHRRRPGCDGDAHPPGSLPAGGPDP